MRKMLVVFVAGVAALGLADCGGSKSPKSTPTTPATARPARSGTSSRSTSGRSTGHGLAAYVKCLGQHGVDVKQAAAAKATGGAGAELRRDPHYATAAPICKHLLPT